ncbi:MAG: NTP transferase domain-containing protein [Bacillota bacterium]
MSKLWAVVLAAGEGKRMRSRLPKVIHPICGRPMLNYILESAAELTGNILIVVGHGASQVIETTNDNWQYVHQENQLGTGHAVMETLGELPREGTLLVLCGDTPLLESVHLKKLLDSQGTNAAAVATTVLQNPYGYGRVVRDGNGLVEKVVEDKDAALAEKEIREINTGTYCFDLNLLRRYLPHLNTDNVQKEYYLPEVLNMFYKDNLGVGAYCIDDYRVGLGINNRVQLAEATSLVRVRINAKLMVDGVTLIDPATVYIDRDVLVGPDTIIGPNCVIEGKTTIGECCHIGPGTHLENATIKDRAVVEHSVIRNRVVQAGSRTGPYAYLD